MTRRILERFRPIGGDTPNTELPDRWTSRVSTRKWGGDAVPPVEQVAARDVWLIRNPVAGSRGRPARRDPVSDAEKESVVDERKQRIATIQGCERREGRNIRVFRMRGADSADADPHTSQTKGRHPA